MDDPFLVRRVERVGDLRCDFQGLRHRNRILEDPIRERRASDQFEDQRGHTCRVLDPIDAADVRMIQSGEHVRLAREPRTPIGIGGEQCREELQRDVAIQLRVTGAIHLTHPAGPQQIDDLVGAEARPGREAHAGGAIIVECS